VIENKASKKSQTLTIPSKISITGKN